MNLEDVARALMGLHGGQGWRVGMVNICGQVIGNHSDGHGWVTHGCASNGHGICLAGHEELPDLKHAGTVALLMDDAEKAIAQCGPVWLERTGPKHVYRWACTDGYFLPDVLGVSTYATKPEAILAALLSQEPG